MNQGTPLNIIRFAFEHGTVPLKSKSVAVLYALNRSRTLLARIPYQSHLVKNSELQKAMKYLYFAYNTFQPAKRNKGLLQ
jgi:hypothetical protein